MIPVYVSLAQTYNDDKQYTKAIDYYHKELKCRQGDNEQVRALKASFNCLNNSINLYTCKDFERFESSILSYVCLI